MGKSQFGRQINGKFQTELLKGDGSQTTVSSPRTSGFKVKTLVYLE